MEVMFQALLFFKNLFESQTFFRHETFLFIFEEIAILVILIV